MAGNASYTPPTTRSSHAAEMAQPPLVSRPAGLPLVAALPTPPLQPLPPQQLNRLSRPAGSAMGGRTSPPNSKPRSSTYRLVCFDGGSLRREANQCPTSNTGAQSSAGHTSAGQGTRTSGHSAPTAGGGRRATEEQGSHTSGLSLADIMKRLEQNK
ncbi:MAG: hypothetical protein U1U88_001796 [Lawsonella clevelandensis]